MLCLGERLKASHLIVFCAILLLGVSAKAFSAEYPVAEMDPKGYPAQNTGCLAPGKCHAGIEPIRAHNSEMAKQIYDMGSKLGDPNGCVVCHGGDPKEEKDAKKAHTGAPEGSPLDTFVLHSASVWVNQKICGQCHKEWVYAQYRSIMQTEAGKIQGAVWGWGPAGTGYAAKYGNYDVDDPDGPEPVFGTAAYKEYTKELMKAYPDNFPAKLVQVPKTDVANLKEKPHEAIYTYIRTDCQRCHVGVKGRNKRGDFRGMGCAACHIPYNNAGLYEGGDQTVKRDETGHAMVHSIQSSRKAKVVVNDVVYSGIPHETCVSCHNRGKRIGVSFQGLMEFPYGSPFTADGEKQPKLHTKVYQFIKDDTHHKLKSREGNPEGGLLCQDCHATTSLHGNGNITGTLLANVEVECSDCHGTATLYPWELPLGWGDEFGRELDMNKPRGLAKEPLENSRKYATLYPPQDGYLLTTRGNPLGNVVREGDKVTVHSASGLNFEVPTLKSINLKNNWQNRKAAIAAKIQTPGHLEKIECYGCHSAWAPQCYGCHVKVDFSGDKKATDWVAAGNTHFPDGHTAESIREGKPPVAPGVAFGKTSENRSYLRWENPVLGINGEGRISPIVPGCQQITTVIGPNGETLIHNKIWRTPPNTEGGGVEGQRGIDMAPAAPHTTDRQARECTSCHATAKALGYGTHDGRYLQQYTRGIYVDIMNEKGQLVTKTAQFQISPIPDLPMDLDQVVTREGEQVQSVGQHWPLSGPLTKDQRDHMERVGVCLSCHKEVPTGKFAYRVLSRAGSVLGLVPKTDQEHQQLIGRALYLAATVEVFGGIIIATLVAFLVIYFVFRRKKKA
ncbi:MAG: cytochrome C [Deltaproteobacteria bacterium]|nr:MAG: cytochrome C [Deltaproteobacteria bacterium]